VRGPHRDLLPRVAVLTLVPHRKDDRAVRLAASREVASPIGGARFIELDGNDHWYFAGARQMIEAIKGFVGALPPDHRPAGNGH
jgi:hypothetical protein